ncbi:hypothetical protein CDAR_177321 [Caerostris darwini]|uniref:Uncharacterized protein n=1 Tax=Caerostris darwini TaxID=1538125 RepID=A0AAV4P170_9ARAC|nr:hypothetical protein CDAR_177321 [Caerostris darwini]
MLVSKSRCSPVSHPSSPGHYKTPFDAAEKYYLANGGGDYFNKLLFHRPYCNFRLFLQKLLSIPQKEFPSVDGCRDFLWHEARLNFCQERCGSMDMSKHSGHRFVVVPFFYFILSDTLELYIFYAYLKIKYTSTVL